MKNKFSNIPKVSSSVSVIAVLAVITAFSTDMSFQITVVGKTNGTFSTLPALEVAAWPNCSRLAITSSWDDGRGEDIDMSQRMVNQGYKGAFGMNSGSWMVQAGQLNDLVSKGMELMCHTFGHTCTEIMSPSESFIQFLGGKCWLEPFQNSPVVTCAYSNCHEAKNHYDELKQAGYLTGRICGGTFDLNLYYNDADYRYHHHAHNIEYEGERVSFANEVSTIQDDLAYMWGHSFALAYVGLTMDDFENFLIATHQPDAWYTNPGDAFTYLMEKESSSITNISAQNNNKDLAAVFNVDNAALKYRPVPVTIKVTGINNVNDVQEVQVDGVPVSFNQIDTSSMYFNVDIERTGKLLLIDTINIDWDPAMYGITLASVDSGMRLSVNMQWNKVSDDVYQVTANITNNHTEAITDVEVNVLKSPYWSVSFSGPNTFSSIASGGGQDVNFTATAVAGKNHTNSSDNYGDNLFNIRIYYQTGTNRRILNLIKKITCPLKNKQTYPVPNMYVIGPFIGSSATSYPPETEIDYSTSYNDGAGGQVSWDAYNWNYSGLTTKNFVRYPTKVDYINLHPLNYTTDQQINNFYFVTYINSPDARSIKFNTYFSPYWGGSGRGGTCNINKIFLNDIEVQPGTPVSLNQGINKLLVKFTFNTLSSYNDWTQYPYGKFFEVMDTNNNIVTDLTFSPFVTGFTPTKIIADAQPSVIASDGSDTSVISARVCDDNNNQIFDSTAEITFSLSGGQGRLIPPSVIQAVNGIATVTYESGTQEATVTITATSPGLTQDTVDIILLSNTPPDTPSGLQCNGQTINPLANLKPLFSWTFNDPDISSGDSQGSYRILVADNQTSIDADNGNVWDSNKVDSANGNTVYGGPILLEGTQYYWKVMVWDSLDASGQYSDAEMFTTLIVTASTNDGNVEENTLDNNPVTRWSADGDGQWIMYDLSEIRTVQYLDISFYNGNQRAATFDIELSEDGTNWTQVWTGQSSGTTLDLEKFDFTDTDARYVRIVGHGNSQSTWNSITEVNIGSIYTGPISPRITVVSPNGGEVWTAGTQANITWSSVGAVGNVNIDLSTDGGSTWTSLVAGTANDGTQVITVPNSPTTSGRIRVQVPSGSPSDTSNMNFTIGTSPQPPSISVDKTNLDFGEVAIGNNSTLNFQITNTGGGILSGSISSDKKWITVIPTSFVVDPAGEDNTVIVNVTVDNEILNQSEGQHTGTISITSNGGPAEVTVNLTATCVLVKPNPYDPTKGNLTFFGDGIVPDDTTIRIYTLGGKLIKTLSGDSAKSRAFEGQTIIWDGKNEDGEQVTNSIYIYTYESPKEKGVGKFTVINKP